MGLIQHLTLRRLWLAVWLFAAAGVLLDVLVGGAVPLTVAAGVFFGLGAGVELTLFAQRRFLRLMPDAAFTAIDNATDLERDEYFDVIEGLRHQGLSSAEAHRLVADIPSGLAQEEGMVIAMRRHGEEH